MEACSAQTNQEQIIQRSDFPWEQSLGEIKDLSVALYTSEKRLPNRAHVENNKVVFSLEEEKASSWGLEFNQIKTSYAFLENIKKHIKKIREQGYASELIYSDIGHVHIFSSDEDFEELDSKGVSSDFAEYYEYIFQSKKTKFLYHTAEQLRKPQTEEEGYREANRNIVGDANGNIKVTPFSKRIEGYGQIFTAYINASSGGCFSAGGTKFDMSLSSPN
ncbi:MAG: hypothetical protein ACRBBP_00755 [Bdellovibrionales bacterium]